jgi:hypothetical protein
MWTTLSGNISKSQIVTHFQSLSQKVPLGRIVRNSCGLSDSSLVEEERMRFGFLKLFPGKIKFLTPTFAERLQQLTIDDPFRSRPIGAASLGSVVLQM